MKFSEFFLLKEGGNAIKSSTRINQENVEATMNTIYKTLLPKLKLKQSDTASLGSTGKKKPGGSSGDIDLALSIQALLKNNNLETTTELFDLIVSVVKSTGKDYKDMRSMGIVSVAWDIENTDGLQEDSVVQLDLMVVDSIDWASWAYYSPSEWESPWKGLYRNEVLYAIAKYMDYKVLEKAFNKEGIEVDATWERHFFDLNKGLMKGTQTALGKKGITKTTKTLDKLVISQQPNDVVKMMFGPKFNANDVLTWEDSFKLLMNDDFVYKKDRKNILKMVKDGILKKGYPVPEELDKVA